MGTFYSGDNLDILQRYIADASVGLVYLAPPFNSAMMAPRLVKLRRALKRPGSLYLH